jgi:hypothetical protein
MQTVAANTPIEMSRWQTKTVPIPVREKRLQALCPDCMALGMIGREKKDTR